MRTTLIVSLATATHIVAGTALAYATGTDPATAIKLGVAALVGVGITIFYRFILPLESE